MDSPGLEREIVGLFVPSCLNSGALRTAIVARTARCNQHFKGSALAIGAAKIGTWPRKLEAVNSRAGGQAQKTPVGLVRAVTEFDELAGNFPALAFQFFISYVAFGKTNKS